MHDEPMATKVDATDIENHNIEAEGYFQPKKYDVIDVIAMIGWVVFMFGTPAYVLFTSLASRIGG